MCAKWQRIYRGCTIANESENSHMSWWDKRILEQFADIKEMRSFQELVLATRRAAGLPSEGLNPDRQLRKDEPFFFWKGQVPKRSLKIVERAAVKICDELNVGHHLDDIIVMYIAQGEKYDRGLQMESVETIGCYVKMWGDDILIGIRPGASKNQVRVFLEENFDDFEEHFKLSHPQNFKRVNAKPKRARNKTIIELYKQGLLTAAGLVNQKNALQYFKDSGLKPLYNLGDFAIYSGIKLPGVDAIKKVIERHRKLQRK